MLMDEIKAGSVVQLKSGGPRMTVSEVGQAQFEERLSAWCDWFVQDKAPWKKENGVFPLTSLKLIEP
jgi:uncharacterized protein YodC (DUF2158 family)